MYDSKALSSKRFLVNIPQFVLSGLKVNFCLEFKYLGHVLVESWDATKRDFA